MLFLVRQAKFMELYGTSTSVCTFVVFAYGWKNYRLLLRALITTAWIYALRAIAHNPLSQEVYFLLITLHCIQRNHKKE